MLQLKIGAKVLLTANIDVGARLINGQVGKIRPFQIQRGKVMMVYAEFKDKKAGLKAMVKGNLSHTNRLVSIEKKVLLNIRRNTKKLVAIKYTQFPLTLSFTYIIHKGEGISLENAVISFALIKKQKSFMSR